VLLYHPIVEHQEKDPFIEAILPVGIGPVFATSSIRHFNVHIRDLLKASFLLFIHQVWYLVVSWNVYRSHSPLLSCHGSSARSIESWRLSLS
jgi:hypothetical protein